VLKEQDQPAALFLAETAFIADDDPISDILESSDIELAPRVSEAAVDEVAVGASATLNEANVVADNLSPVRQEGTVSLEPAPDAPDSEVAHEQPVASRVMSDADAHSVGARRSELEALRSSAPRMSSDELQAAFAAVQEMEGVVRRARQALEERQQSLTGTRASVMRALLQQALADKRKQR
jgi:hypothetical protein